MSLTSLTTTMKILASSLTLILLHSTVAESNTFPGDIAALKSFLAALDPASIPPGSCLASWDFKLDPCSSAFSTHFTCGLRCDATSSDSTSLTFSRITDLSLDSIGYSGPLSPSIWSLPFLQSLDLSNNRFYGPIPSPLPISSLPPLLRRISLSHNSLSGSIPSFSASPSLEELYLDGNRLSGPFISTSFPSLRRLDLQSNNFSGSFPDLRSLSNLNFLDLSDNSFSGPFPPDSLPSSLFELSMRNNLLTGNLPGSLLASLPLLQVLDLSHNALSGPVPSAAFEHPALEQLALSGNAFEWVEEPDEIIASSNMVALDLSHNEISGLLPEFVGSMPQLTAVVLEDNRFTGLIPTQYAMRAAGIPGAWVAFERLLLGGNYLYGPIPGLMQGMKNGAAAVVSLADNCLFRCPEYLYFCAGREQKPAVVCRDFNPMIP
ncbi:probable inactive leucine-rich repeat receptor kinase XIAO [Phalaenopsis equestris]|uniref:probable inactive leucine-rich repeat receptor kinase XIAO n=1 Tax=Phalaenopsis equestris TaxID=78828 RepID=UPI0009E5160E|nr:probable inactive leucine-rich repeat receptor kinase XIAO [Phalaenopsis equestris]